LLASIPARRRTQLLLLVLVAATLIAWGGAPWGTFQFDDFNNVVRDPATTHVTALFERLPHGLRPLTRLSYFVDAHVFGLRAAGFLSINLILHLATVLVVFALARRRLDVVAACLAALVFSLQPANAEVIAYVSGRSTGLMTPLLLGGLLLHDRGRRGWALGLFLLACLAKEVALVFPVLVLAWEATRTESRRGVTRELCGYAIAAGAMGVVLLALANYRSILGYSLELRPMLDNLLANGRAVPVTLSLWARPWALSPDHDFVAGGHIAESVAGLVLLAGAVAAAWALRRRSAWLALALAWPVIALLPTNSVIAKIDLVTEKPLYLAWFGPALALGACLAALLDAASSRAVQRLATAATATLLCALAGASLWRASLWRDPIRLWEDATTKAPGKSRCWNNLGMAYLTARRDAAAVAAFERAVRVDPGNEVASTNLRTGRMLCGEACTPD
jgi:tetratricopeptide (TPR) repeat protein